MKRILLTVGTGALAIAIAACGDSTTPLLSSQDVTSADSSDIAAQASADATTSDVQMLNGVSGTMGWSVAAPNSGVSLNFMASARPDLSADFKSDCTFNSVDGRFHCLETVNGNGVTVIRTIALYDSTGATMNHFDSTTASMNIQATLSGIISLKHGADTVNGSRNLTATGLLGHNTTRTWNGTGDGTHGAYWTDSVASRTSHVTYSTTFTNVVVDLPRSANPYPASGTITRTVTGTGVVIKNGRKRTITVTRTVTITFNGSETVPMIVGDDHYTVDLSTGIATHS